LTIAAGRASGGEAWALMLGEPAPECPAERMCFVRVPMAHEAEKASLQIESAAEVTVGKHPAREDAKPDLDLAMQPEADSRGSHAFRPQDAADLG
jgi:hypothetical protein